jgi:hypothetical protein
MVTAPLAALAATIAPIIQARADELKGQSQSQRQGQSQSQIRSQNFEIQYGPSGITSLRRVHDVADTEYIGPNGALGRLVVRYRTAAPHARECTA